MAAARSDWLATVTAVLAYLQIVLGAVLRHVPVDAQPAAFLLAVKFHLFLAAVLTLHIVLARWIGAEPCSARAAARPLGAACWLYSLSCNCSSASAPGS